MNMLDNMGMELWSDADRTYGRLPVTPWLCRPGAGLSVGALAILVDMVIGHTPTVTINPTIDMSVRWLAAAPQPGTVVRAEGSILRFGRQQVIGEAMVFDDTTGELLGWGSAAFINRPMGPPLGSTPAQRSEVRPAASVETVLGTTSPHPGVVDLPYERRVANGGEAVPTVMGGIQAVVAELAAEHAAIGGSVVCGLSIRYLRLVKVGPLRAVADALPGTAIPQSVRVKLIDAGDRHRLIAHAVADVRPAHPTI
jgi:acyl-coenzyme A thioesterase PaaI-like protein